MLFHQHFVSIVIVALAPWQQFHILTLLHPSKSG